MARREKIRGWLRYMRGKERKIKELREREMKAEEVKGNEAR